MHLGGTRRWVPLSEDSKQSQILFWSFTIQLLGSSTSDMMFHILVPCQQRSLTARETSASRETSLDTQRKILGARESLNERKKKWREGKVRFDFLVAPQSSPGSPRVDISLPLVTIVQPLPPFPEFIEEPSRPSLLPSLFG